MLRRRMFRRLNFFLRWLRKIENLVYREFLEFFPEDITAEWPPYTNNTKISTTIFWKVLSKTRNQQHH